MVFWAKTKIHLSHFSHSPKLSYIWSHFLLLLFCGWFSPHFFSLRRKIWAPDALDCLGRIFDSPQPLPVYFSVFVFGSLTHTPLFHALTWHIKLCQHLRGFPWIPFDPSSSEPRPAWIRTPKTNNRFNAQRIPRKCRFPSRRVRIVFDTICLRGLSGFFLHCVRAVNAVVACSIFPDVRLLLLRRRSAVRYLRFRGCAFSMKRTLPKWRASYGLWLSADGPHFYSQFYCRFHSYCNFTLFSFSHSEEV